MKVTIESDELVKKCEATKALLQTLRNKIMGLGPEAQMYVKDKTPVKTGKTKASWSLILTTGGWVVTPAGREDIVKYLEFGTKPHIIEAQEGSVLAFDIDGETVFAKVVHHPGTKPLGIVRETRNVMEKRLAELAASAETSIGGLWK